MDFYPQEGPIGAGRDTPERIQARKQWVEMVKEMSVDYMNNSVFIDESGLNANLRRTQGWAPKGKAAKVLTSQFNFHLGRHFC